MYFFFCTDRKKEFPDPMSSLADKLKPSAPVRAHLFLAAALWTVVGSTLVFFGVWWVRDDGRALLWWLLIPVVVIGFLKAHFILMGAATRITTRIIERGDGRCLGGFLSPMTWLLVLGMMGGGRLLRAGGIPMGIVGLIYAGVGLALFVASFRMWSVWRGYELPAD